MMADDDTNRDSNHGSGSEQPDEETSEQSDEETNDEPPPGFLPDDELPDADWYKQHAARDAREEVTATGFGFTLKGFRDMKYRIESAALLAKPRGVDNRSNLAYRTNRRAVEVGTFLQEERWFGRPPPYWRDTAIRSMVRHAHINIKKREDREAQKNANKADNGPGTGAGALSSSTSSAAGDPTPASEQGPSSVWLHITGFGVEEVEVSPGDVLANTNIPVGLDDMLGLPPGSSLYHAMFEGQPRCLLAGRESVHRVVTLAQKKGMASVPVVRSPKAPPSAFPGSTPFQPIPSTQGIDTHDAGRDSPKRAREATSPDLTSSKRVRPEDGDHAGAGQEGTHGNDVDAISELMSASHVSAAPSGETPAPDTRQQDQGTSNTTLAGQGKEQTPGRDGEDRRVATLPSTVSQQDAAAALSGTISQGDTPMALSGTISQGDTPVAPSGTVSQEDTPMDEDEESNTVVADDTSLAANEAQDVAGVGTAFGEEGGEESEEEGGAEIEVEGGEESEAEDEEEDEEEEEEDVEDPEQRAASLRTRLFEEGFKHISAKLTFVQIPWLSVMVAMFPLLSLEMLSGTASFSLPNWGLAPGFEVNAYQLMFACWAIFREGTPWPGGTLADEAGAGKTVTLLLLWLIGYFHQQNYLEVYAEWRTGVSKHHLARCADHDRKCPSALLQPIACWCEYRSRQLFPRELRRGVTLILTPPAALLSFRKDAIMMLQGGKILERTYPPRIAIHAPDSKVTDFTRELSADEVNATCMLPDWRPAERKDEQTTTRNLGGKKGVVQGTWSKARLGGPRPLGAGATTVLAPTHAGRVAIVTTRQTVEKRVLSRYRATRTTWWTHKKTTIPSTHPIDLFQAARIIWDEAHMDITGSTMRTLLDSSKAQSLLAYPGKNMVTPLWGATGTPYGGTAVAIVGYLVASLQTSVWRAAAYTAALPDDRDGARMKDVDLPAMLAYLDVYKHEVGHALHDLDKGKVDELKTAFDWLCNTAKHDPEGAVASARYGRLCAFIRTVIPAFQMRRCATTRWFDEEPVIPKTCHILMSVDGCRSSPADADIIADLELHVKTECDRKDSERTRVWERAGSREDQRPAPTVPKGTRGYTAALVGASLPSLVQHWKTVAHGGVSPSQTDPTVKHWLQRGNQDVFDKVLKTVKVSKSAKISALIKILDSIAEETRSDGLRCKVLIGSCQPLVLKTLCRVLCQRYGDETVLDHSGGQSSKARERVRAAFLDDDNAWIMVCALKSIGVGANLFRANYSILMEPSGILSNSRQWFCRVDRRGQEEPVCHGWVLFDEASSLEQRLLKTTHFIENIENGIFKTEETMGGSRDPIVIVDDDA